MASQPGEMNKEQRCGEEIVFRASVLRRVVTYFFFAIILLIVIYSSEQLLSGGFRGTADDWIGFLLCGFVLLLVSLVTLGILLASFDQLTIDSHGLTKRGLLGKRWIAWDQIAKVKVTELGTAAAAPTPFALTTVSSRSGPPIRFINLFFDLWRVLDHVRAAIEKAQGADTAKRMFEFFGQKESEQKESEPEMPQQLVSGPGPRGRQVVVISRDPPPLHPVRDLIITFAFMIGGLGVGIVIVFWLFRLVD